MSTRRELLRGLTLLPSLGLIRELPLLAASDASRESVGDGATLVRVVYRTYYAPPLDEERLLSAILRVGAGLSGSTQERPFRPRAVTLGRMGIQQWYKSISSERRFQVTHTPLHEKQYLQPDVQYLQPDVELRVSYDIKDGCVEIECAGVDAA